MTKPEKIKDDQVYSLSDIVENQWIPYAKSFPGVRALVLKDKDRKDMLETRIVGEGTNRRYYIGGANLKKFIQKLGDEYRL